MSRDPIDLHQKIRDIAGHSGPLPPEASTPLPHFRRAVADAWNLLRYLDRNLDRGTLRPSALDEHFGRLHAMLLITLTEAFERFLKEVAAACVDFLAPYVLDDRFDKFTLKGSSLAAHFGADTLGKALCESSTWLDCDDVNDRFRRLLGDPVGQTSFLLWPKQAPTYLSLAVAWQLRHTVVHNVGVMTRSDAIKLRLLVKGPVPADHVLAPTRDDLRYLKRFLDETANDANRRVGGRLADVLTALHQIDPTLFAAPAVADAVSATFGIALPVAGATGHPGE